jgi:HK97 family phage prohead protease
MKTKPKIDAVEYRVARAGSAKLVEKVMEGHAAVFNTFSSPDLGFMEVIRPGAFTKTLQESDIRALWNHNSDLVLGRNIAKTLELSEDKDGLFSKIHLPDNTWGNDCRTSVMRGDVSQMSFRFRTIKDNWYMDDSQGGALCRELLEVRLLEVSPCTFPAYPATDISARAVAQAAAGVAGSKDETLFKALLRLKAGEELRAEEIALLTDFAGNLQKQLSKPPEPAPGHSAPAKPPEETPDTRHLVDVEQLKRQLEILETQI